MEYEIEESLINEKVGAWLLEKGNTREELAGELGMHRMSLGNKLNDVTSWTWPEVLRLAGILGCSARDFVGNRQDGNESGLGSGGVGTKR